MRRNPRGVRRNNKDGSQDEEVARFENTAIITLALDSTAFRSPSLGDFEGNRRVVEMGLCHTP